MTVICVMYEMFYKMHILKGGVLFCYYLHNSLTKNQTKRGVGKTALGLKAFFVNKTKAIKI